MSDRLANRKMLTSFDEIASAGRDVREREAALACRVRSTNATAGRHGFGFQHTSGDANKAVFP
jgi:hypothetical protein